MIDLSLLRNSAQETIEALQKKDPLFDAQQLKIMDELFRKQSVEVEALRKEKNDLAVQAKSGVTDLIRSRSIEVGKELKTLEDQLAQTEVEFKKLYATCPNIMHQDVPAGNKESNKVVREIGSQPSFSFKIKNHLELGNSLGWFDFEGAARMAAGNFALYRGDAVRLLYSLTQLMIKNNMKYGFEPILPPYLVNQKSLEIVGQLPKFAHGVYKIEDENLYLTPTAEVNLTNLYRDQIFQDHELPKRLTAWTSCFRREAGNYGHQERGLIRIHEFEKVELFSITKPETSYAELDLMMECAENILQQLGLHYRVSLLAAQDSSFQSAKTYDIEVWMPGQNAYYEVSSASNCTDFQARRGKIRYRGSDGKTVSAHTLNASSLALPRLMVAIMETYQQEDGSIALPEIIKNQGWF
jgi:seryl-tRNA synthetase